MVTSFVVDIDNPDSNKKNEDMIKGFHRVTHSRYECGTPAWTTTLTGATEPNVQWNMLLDMEQLYKPVCPYVHPDGGESWHMTGHLCIPKRAC